MIKWLQRLWRFLFVTESESDFQRNHIPKGRIASRDRRSEVRVLKQYPKKGNFRFPLIRDEVIDKPTKQLASNKVNTTTIQNRERTVSERNRMDREKFSGENFQASDVPSPIFGFRKRQPLSYVEQRSPKVREQVPSGDFNSSEVQNKKRMTVGEPAPPPVVETLHHTERLIASTVEKMDATPLTTTSTINQESPAIDTDIKQPVKQESQLIQDTFLSGQALVAQPKNKQELENTTERSFHTETLQRNQTSLPVQPLKVVRDEQTQEKSYTFPLVSLLNTQQGQQEENDSWLAEQKELLSETLKNFNVDATVIAAVKGPSVTRLEVQPNRGVKVNKVTNLTDDIKLNLSAKEIRIEAPIPGRNAIGIEVPNPIRRPVGLKEIINSTSFQNNRSPLTVALGVDISGKPVITDLRKMPHGLIAGATGSGKSVCINAMLISLLYKADPDEVKLMLIDPKVVELAPYNDLPHLVTPVVTDVKEATIALKWAVEEMEKRYERFAELKVRDIEKYNEAIQQCECDKEHEHMPYLVIIIDELADLMMVSPQEVEDAICRIAQKARACGIHLLIATQRPSVDVITGLIKANIPTRIAFSVSSQIDSRTIIDMSGAEKLLGQGDMLFLENSSPKPIRLQGNFVSDDEVERITTFVKRQREAKYLIQQADLVELANDEEQDELFLDACDFIFSQGAASTSSLQRRFRIGYNRAANLIDKMEEYGMVSQQNGSKPRKVLLTKKEFYAKMDKDV